MADLGTLAPWRMVIRNITIGGSNNAYRFSTPPEGFGLPDVSSSITSYAQLDGGFAQGDRHEARTITGEILIYPSNRGGDYLWRAVETLKAAFVRSSVDLPIEFRLGDARAVRVYGRPTRLEMTELDVNFGLAKMAFQIVCGDPLLRSSESAVQLTPASGSAYPGREYPKTYPVTYGSAVSTGGAGVATISNDGNYPVPWTASIRGPVGSPQLTQLSSGRYVRWNGFVPNGSILQIDARTRVVTLDGDPAFSMMDGIPDWFWIEPGVNEIAYNATSGTGQCSISYASAWM